MCVSLVLVMVAFSLFATQYVAATGMHRYLKLDASIPAVNPYKVGSGDSCVGQCALHFVDQLKLQLRGGNAAQLLNLNYNEFLIAFSNVTFFEKFCKFYHNFQYCYSACPSSYLQELLSRSATIIDHFCVYNFKEIRERFGCLSRLDGQFSKQCLSTCTPYHNAVNSVISNFKHLALNGDSTAAEKYLNESCEYVICTLHCDIPTIAHTCGFDTANLVIDLTRKSFASMEIMALDTGAVSRWPRTCADIKAYKLPTPSKEVPPRNDSLPARSSQPQHQAQVSSSEVNSVPNLIVFFIIAVMSRPDLYR